MNPISFIQGRLLTPPSPQILQAYPPTLNDLCYEVKQANQLTYDSIELFEPDSINSYPHSPSLIDIDLLLNLFRHNNLELVSLTYDPLLSTLSKDKFEILCQHYQQLILNIKSSSIYKIVLPFLGQSCFSTNHLSFEFLDFVFSITPPSITILIESNLPNTQLKPIFDKYNHQSIGFCYDTGNRYYKGINYKYDIESFSSLICHVHIKDKCSSLNNVPLGNGCVPFKEIITTFKSSYINYQGIYVIESHRGTFPIQSYKFYLNYLRQLLNED